MASIFKNKRKEGYNFMSKNTKKINNMDGWRILFISIVVCSLVPSLLFTVIAFFNTGSVLYASLLFVGSAITIEAVKIGFIKMSVSQKDWHKGGRAIMFTTGICAMFASLVFSFAFTTNQSNAVKNKFYANTDESKAVNKAVATRDSMIARIEGEINDLKAEKKAQLSVLDPVNYRSKREKITGEFNAEIKTKSAELTRQQNTASSPTAIVSKTDKRMDVALGSVLTPEQESLFFKFLVVFVELGGTMSTIILSIPRRNVKKTVFVYEDDVQDQEDNSNDGKVIDIDSKTKVDRSIDLETPQNASKGVWLGKSTDTASNETNLNNTDISVYVAKMIETKRDTKNGSESRGYQWLSKQTELDEETCRKIKGHLENIGTIKTVGIKTFIL